MRVVILLITLLSVLHLTAQRTYVPDNEFEQALINLSLDDIFDDSVTTSAIDTQTEKRIRDEMISLGTGITLIVIAHRISSVMNLDEILYLDKGKIIERGNHKELMNKKGYYSELYNMQINPELKV